MKQEPVVARETGFPSSAVWTYFRQHQHILGLTGELLMEMASPIIIYEKSSIYIQFKFIRS